MANSGSWVKWNPDEGTIESSLGRLITVDTGFIEGFYEELKQSGGIALGKMILHDLGKDLNIKVPPDRDFLWKDFEALIDKQFESFDSVENMPASFSWDGKGRALVYMGVFPTTIWPVNLIGSLKSSAARHLTPRGAQAIIGQASRRAGKQIGDLTANGYGWNNIKIIFDSIGEIMTPSFIETGWGKYTIITDYEHLVMYFVLRNSFEIAAEGKDASLIIVRNLIEGVGEYLSEREGMKSRSREYRLEDGSGDRVILLATIPAGKEVDWDAYDWKKRVA